jgi:hypothetical protein
MIVLIRMFYVQFGSAVLQEQFETAHYLPDLRSALAKLKPVGNKKELILAK